MELLLARALRSLGQDEDAERELLVGIQELERQRVSLQDVALQVSFFEQGLPLYDDMVRLQIERDEPDRALAFLERARSRQIVDSLRRFGRSADGTTASSGVGSDLPLEPGSIRRGLSRDVALLYYYAQGDRLLTWVLTREASHLVKHDMPAGRLQQLVAAHRAALEQPSSMETARRTGAALFEALVTPVQPAITAKRLLIVVPAIALQGVPFASLVDERTGHYLVEDHVLGIAPSGTVFVQASTLARSRPSAGRALVVRQPDSRGAFPCAIPQASRRRGRGQ